MTSLSPALSFEGLSKHFGRIRAVDRLTLDVAPGQMAGFLGPNGAGKSTSLYMIPRLVRPSAGHLRVFGHDVWRDFRPAMATVGVMVETPAFYDYLPGRKNLELAARLRGKVDRYEIDTILERIGLAERHRDKVRTYSMGMKQRLGIGRALLGNPRLLVLDEPTNGMDPEGTREILSFLRERVENHGLTVFLSSHLLHEVEAYCDTVFVINQGRLVASGRVADILKPHERIVRVTFSGTPPELHPLQSHTEILHVEAESDDTWEVTLSGVDSAWLNHHLHQSGIRVTALAPKQKTLKDFFLSITGETVDQAEKEVVG